MKNDRAFFNTLEDNIRKCGGVEIIITNKAQVDTHGRVLNIYVIGTWKCRDRQQHPKSVERKYQHINNPASCMMKCTSSPAPVCLLVIVYVCYLLNHTKNPIIKRSVSLEVITMTTPNISPL